MKSQYIPKDNRPTEDSTWTKVLQFFNRSCYIGKLKISLETYVGGICALASVYIHHTKCLNSTSGVQLSISGIAND